VRLIELSLSRSGRGGIKVYKLDSYLLPLPGEIAHICNCLTVCIILFDIATNLCNIKSNFAR